MCGRSFRIALLLVEVLWLNVIVPGHRRGIIALPGEQAQTCKADAVSVDDCCCETHSQPNQRHKEDPAQHCLICYFAARLTPPPVIDLTPPPLRFLEALPPPVAQIITVRLTIPTYDGRAPPGGISA